MFSFHQYEGRFFILFSEAYIDLASALLRNPYHDFTNIMLLTMASDSDIVGMDMDFRWHVRRTYPIDATNYDLIIGVYL